MPVVELLIGMIASGKSTYAAKRAAEGAIIINDDAITLATHGGNYSLYDKKLKLLYKSIEYNIIVNALMMGRDVVIDRPNFKASTRARYLSIARAIDIPVKAIKFRSAEPIEHARRRYQSDSRGQSLSWWLGVAVDHRAKWVEPDLLEGFSVIINYD